MFEDLHIATTVVDGVTYASVAGLSNHLFAVREQAAKDYAKRICSGQMDLESMLHAKGELDSLYQVAEFIARADNSWVDEFVNSVLG